MSTKDAATGRRLLPSFWRTAPTESALLPLTESDSMEGTTATRRSASTPIRPSPDRSRSERAVYLAPPISGSGTAPDTARTETFTGPLTTSPLARSRAHTVSVSLASARRPDERRTSRVLDDLESGLSAPQTGSGSVPRRKRRGSIAQRSAKMWTVRSESPVSYELPREDHDLNDDMVGMLDVIDMQVSTINHLQNMTNTLIFPPLPQFWSRRPEVVLPNTPAEDRTDPKTADATAITRRRRASTVSRVFSPQLPPSAPPTAFYAAPTRAGDTSLSPADPASIETSPTTATEDGIADDISLLEKDHELDRHVKHVLISKSKRDTIKRIAMGTWAFIKTPLGAVTAIYGFLVAFWGAAIVLFLLNWIPTSSKNRQDVWVEISSQVETGLFTVTGVGLIPWRLRDTYRMSIIWTLRQRITRRRKAQGLAEIDDPNDLPDSKDQLDYVSVLTEKEQDQLRYQQEAFAHSQTWYRPHATATHRAFPMSWALWNTILMDGNSFFQCLLCGCMWGLTWHTRPPWTTGCLIPLSFGCGIGAGVLIWQGSKRTKKTEHVEDTLRTALGVSSAMKSTLTQDGPVQSSKPSALPLTRSPATSPAISPEKSLVSDEKPAQPKSGRRSTITFGDIPNSAADSSVEMTEKTERDRAAMVAAPERNRELLSKFREE